MTSPTLRLKHLADLSVSSVDKKSYSYEVPVRLVNYTDVYYGDRIVPELDLMRATATPSEIRAFRLVPGDVVITKDSETADDIGIAAYIERSAPDIVCGYHLAICRPRSAYVDSRFLFWALNSDETRGQFSSGATGVTRYGLRTDVLGDVSLVVPSLPEQRAISSYLDLVTARIDALIGEKRRMLELLNERLQAQYDSWFERLVSAYGLVAVRRWSSGIEQGWSPVCDSEPAGLGESGVIKTSAVSSGRFVATNNKRLPPGTECDTRWLLHDGDLLVTRGSGSRSMVGRACVAYVGRRILTLSDLVYRVRLAQADPEFVAAALLSSPARAHIESSIRTDVGLTLKIRRDDLADIRVPAVPFDCHVSEVAKLTDRLSPHHAAKLMIERQIELLRERKQAFISALVSGEMSVPGS